MNQPATISADYTLRPSEVAATLALLVSSKPATVRPASVAGSVLARIPDGPSIPPDFPPDCAIASSARLPGAAPAGRDATLPITAQRSPVGHRAGVSTGHVAHTRTAPRPSAGSSPQRAAPLRGRGWP